MMSEAEMLMMLTVLQLIAPDKANIPAIEVAHQKAVKLLVLYRERLAQS